MHTPDTSAHGIQHVPHERPDNVFLQKAGDVPHALYVLQSAVNKNKAAAFCVKPIRPSVHPPNLDPPECPHSLARGRRLAGVWPQTDTIVVIIPAFNKNIELVGIGLGRWHRFAGLGRGLLFSVGNIIT